jgi:ABC-type polysaccharide/polyol phosphate transport system ATPase subunit/ABC-type polysaccharide/polyol phosphate export permease
VHPFGSESYELVTSLQDVTFDVAKGEFLGVVGKNGSGKSTLLKCLAGIYPVDAGEIEVRGRVAPLIELGVGFNAELTARDNAIINAVLLGLTPAEAKRRYDAMIAFAELEEFVDLKLKNYSSGMVMRLAFSITVQVDADVILLDEVLAVGDAAFEQKCYARLERLREERRTVVLVSHDMTAVERFCDRAVLLHRGELIEAGESGAVAAAYTRLNEDPRARLRASPLAADGAEPAAPSQPGLKAGPRRRAFGPVAFGGDVRRLLVCTRLLGSANFKLRYLDSALSYLWAVMRPLALFGVLYLFFTKVAGFDRNVHHYPVYLLTAVVLWVYFQQSTLAAVYSLVQNEPLLRKVRIPHAVVPVSVLLTSFFDLCMNLVAVLVLLFASGVTPRVSWLEMPVLILIVTTLAAGVALLLSALYVRFRDVDQIWHVATQALFYGTPVFYVVGKLPAGARRVALVNPLAAVFTEMRHALVDPSAPSAAQAIGGAPRLLVPLFVVVGVFALGVWIFRRESPRVAENL